MKFIKGIFLGTLLGFAIGAAVNDEQRRKAVTAAKNKVAPIGDSVTDNVSQVADTVVDEATAKIDAAGDTVASKVASDEPAR